MSKDTRFKKGQSGNPNGRPKKVEEQGTAYDVILDKKLAGLGKRELSVEEALEQGILKDTFKGKVMAIRKVLKMIERREAALAKKRPDPPPGEFILHHFSENAQSALLILKIAEPDMRVGGCRWNIHTWAAQAALKRPGRWMLKARHKKEIEFFTFDPHKLDWPEGRVYDD